LLNGTLNSSDNLSPGQAKQMGFAGAGIHPESQIRVAGNPDEIDVNAAASRQ
jgi:hypothetical protein